MPHPRKVIVDLNRTPYYHCIQRCVRRSPLCGDDPISGNNYDHRKDLLLNKIKYLAQYFTIDICAFAIMKNHYHLVVKIDRDEALNLTEQQVVSRWQKICSGKDISVRHYLSGEYTAAEAVVAKQIIAEWRSRLYSISWFMKGTNEYLAKLANNEDSCTGHFWEQRFKSKALLDQQALLCCMAYVDLNPSRAGIATTLADSDYTSIQERIFAYERSEQAKFDKKKRQGTATPSPLPHFTKSCQPTTLLPFTSKFDEQAKSNIHKTLPYDLQDYLALVEWTKQHIQPKSKQQKSSKPAVLNHINLHTEAWFDIQRHQERKFADFIAEKETLKAHAAKLNNHWLKGSG